MEPIYQCCQKMVVIFQIILLSKNVGFDSWQQQIVMETQVRGEGFYDSTEIIFLAKNSFIEEQ